jgi:peptide/nickel transport system ATP-binding protein
VTTVKTNTPTTNTPTTNTATTNTSTADALLRVEDLQMHFPGRRRSDDLVRAVDGVSLDVRHGETLGLVGESGCGKSTLGRAIVRAYRPTAGRLRYRRADGDEVDLAVLGERALRPYRQEIRMVFQDPFSSLNPRMTLRDIIGEPLKVNGVARGRALEERVAELLTTVGLRAEHMSRYPHAFSGGQRQRVAIARALALRPRLVIADEAVSALDVSVRAQILNLLARLQDEMDLTYLFISHDLSVVRQLCDRVAVMYLGRVVEIAPTEELFARPRHPYTEALLSAVPATHPSRRGGRDRIVLDGDLPDPSDPPPGCRFHTRCPYAAPRCTTEPPAAVEVAPGRASACHFAGELHLRGAGQAA